MSVLISESLVKKLILQQFPQWAELDIKTVSCGGVDNRSFRLGKKMLLRFPSAECYLPQVEKEQKYLPYLKTFLKTPIPKPIAKGKPSSLYPWPWSVYSWIEGVSANLVEKSTLDLPKIALSLAKFLKELHSIDASHGPLAGEHNFYRGGSLAVYDFETRQALEKLKNRLPFAKAKNLWEEALNSSWEQKPVWVHGDLYPGNILVEKGCLKAVIDFGCMGVGDPACDLVVAWTFLDPLSRKLFFNELAFDEASLQRAKAWALWKALITVLQSKKDEKKQYALIIELLS